MGEFIDAALGFPAVLFGAALLVVIAFWLLVLAGAADHDAFSLYGGPHAGMHGETAHTVPGADAAGDSAVPVTVPVSLAVLIAWFVSLTGSVLVRRAEPAGGTRTLLDSAVLAAALLIAWTVTRRLVRRLRSLFPYQPPPSRLDFVGLTCTVRTGTVSADFGQAEVAAADGSTAVVQVRVQGEDALLGLRSGSTALLYAYDEPGEFFWITPYDQALDPRTAT
ncbi:hypothetical protein AB0M87_25165 [Streptomyces sp. NPDC051320]|uniref:hypothetical protein n=1 Tax=Streptomyces sp. NPDC051320 TaxID=3154644 RepID=UPI00341F61B5